MANVSCVIVAMERHVSLVNPKRTTPANQQANLRRARKSLVKDDKTATITTTKTTIMGTEAMTVGRKATNAMKATTEGVDTKGPRKATTVGVILMVMMATASKAIVAAMKVTTAGTKATATGGIGLHVRAITGLTTSVPMGGKSATACNLVKSGTAASNRSHLTTSWRYERSSGEEGRRRRRSAFAGTTG
jgi:hypothetical protein